jgi:hypothetical protein
VLKRALYDQGVVAGTADRPVLLSDYEPYPPIHAHLSPRIISPPTGRPLTWPDILVYPRASGAFPHATLPDWWEGVP